MGRMGVASREGGVANFFDDRGVLVDLPIGHAW